jgi:2-C-methyl-D-erythritol 4-phosphate cytidylyltransferase
MSTSFYGLIPAAGRGARLGGDLPKQYLPLGGEAMLKHAVRALLDHAEIETVFVVLDPDDVHYGGLPLQEFGERLAPLYCGGDTRRDSVRNGLIAAGNMIEPDDWVLVHDAARPCLAREDLARLIERVRGDATGGLLAVPVPDTLKRGDGDARVVATEPREGLWLAQTPQMFRHGILLRALDAAPGATDEASAVEALGMRPLLVEGSRSNLKVTYPGDVAVAAALLSAGAKQ